MKLIDEIAALQHIKEFHQLPKQEMPPEQVYVLCTYCGESTWATFDSLSKILVYQPHSALVNCQQEKTIAAIYCYCDCGNRVIARERISSLFSDVLSSHIILGIHEYGNENESWLCSGVGQPCLC